MPRKQQPKPHNAEPRDSGNCKALRKRRTIQTEWGRGGIQHAGRTGVHRKQGEFWTRRGAAGMLRILGRPGRGAGVTSAHVVPVTKGQTLVVQNVSGFRGRRFRARLAGGGAELQPPGSPAWRHVGRGQAAAAIKRCGAAKPSGGTDGAEAWVSAARRTQAARRPGCSGGGTLGPDSGAGETRTEERGPDTLGKGAGDSVNAKSVGTEAGRGTHSPGLFADSIAAESPKTPQNRVSN
ncbi:hypothetical protein P7K49_037690 [Saguinus oedipus]|uniref:Uncharacterized protein n=1 Tax=Saguinus oedipus TaxID=9490 RepID=A0ABQ9TIT5_SAGOE|nr:hypothetical protein P7K49_037690 [Saguinus oedipus]